jgi:hypothetical protein
MGSTSHVRFITTAKNRYRTDPRKSHINYLIYDSEWEAEFARYLRINKIEHVKKLQGQTIGMVDRLITIIRTKLFDKVNESRNKIDRAIDEGKNVPVHSGGGFGNDAVVFQGLTENLSSLLTNHQVTDIIPTTPEGILSYILKKDPNHKSKKEKYCYW